MAKKEPAQPDPIGDIVEPDIDRLLEQTSRLAAKAGQEIGLPQDESAPSPADSRGDEGRAEGQEGIDAQLAELEKMLQNVATSTEPSATAGPKVEPPPDKPAGAEVPESGTPQSPPPRESAVKEVPSEPTGPDSIGQEGLDEFDVSVDLSDNKRAAEQEIAERLADPNRFSESAIGESADEEPTSLLGRVAVGGIRGLEWVVIAMDRPFANLSAETKQILGYIGIATLLVAVGGLVYGALGHR